MKGLEHFPMATVRKNGKALKLGQARRPANQCRVAPFGSKGAAMLNLKSFFTMKKKVFFVGLGMAMLFLSPIKGQTQFHFSDIQFWVGTGPFKAALVVDFNDGTNPECFVWGYRFSDTTNVTAEKCFRDIDSADAALSFEINGGFLMSAHYYTHHAVGGTNDYYFATFNSPKVFGNWTMNSGLSEILKDSLWFGASFTPWDTTTWQPIYLPENPVASPNNTGLVTYRKLDPYIYPNPIKSDKAFIKDPGAKEIEIFSLDGRKVATVISENGILNIPQIETGWYLFRWQSSIEERSSLVMIQR
jgi:hypothetical protein